MGFWGCYYDPNVVVNLPWPNFATQKNQTVPTTLRKDYFGEKKKLDSSIFEFKKK
jgi:hypothetical protein